MAAAGTRYRPISRVEFASTMAKMGFGEIVLPGSMEHIYQRAIACKDGSASRFVIRICSSVHMATGSTRDCGEDAIRILLIDTTLTARNGRPGKIVQDWRAFRTQNALTTLRERARDAWRYATDKGMLCECGALMAERTSKRGAFLGCTDFPTCKNTRPIICEKVAA